MKPLYLFVLLVVFISCKKNKDQFNTHKEDYSKYLNAKNTPTLDLAISEKEFWSKRLRKDSSGIGDLGPLAMSYEVIYEMTGDVSNLESAEILYVKAVKIAHSKDVHIRSLASLLMKQQRFNEAKKLLEESYLSVSNKQATEYLLFDLYFEIGNYDKANQFLEKFKKNSDYNYLIRLAKWNKYQGNIKVVIRSLEKAMDIANSRKSKELQIDSYLRLADLYFQIDKIKESYQLCLKTLQLQPDNAQAKKQIAWIVYSYKRNSIEANRILDSIMVINKSPEFYILKAEITDSLR